MWRAYACENGKTYSPSAIEHLATYLLGDCWGTTAEEKYATAKAYLEALYAKLGLETTGTAVPEPEFDPEDSVPSCSSEPPPQRRVTSCIHAPSVDNTLALDAMTTERVYSVNSHNRRCGPVSGCVGQLLQAAGAMLNVEDYQALLQSVEDAKRKSTKEQETSFERQRLQEQVQTQRFKEQEEAQRLRLKEQEEAQRRRLKEQEESHRRRLKVREETQCLRLKVQEEAQCLRLKVQETQRSKEQEGTHCLQLTEHEETLPSNEREETLWQQTTTQPGHKRSRDDSSSPEGVSGVCVCVPRFFFTFSGVTRCTGALLCGRLRGHKMQAIREVGAGCPCPGCGSPAPVAVCGLPRAPHLQADTAEAPGPTAGLMDLSSGGAGSGDISAAKIV